MRLTFTTLCVALAFPAAAARKVPRAVTTDTARPMLAHPDVTTTLPQTAPSPQQQPAVKPPPPPPPAVPPRRFGRFEVVLNGVFGVETGGENGKDLEAKAFAGWRFSNSVRAGIDSRLQAEVENEDQIAPPIGRPAVPTGRDYDLTAGPSIAWMVTRTIQVQALVGVAQPKKTDVTSPVGVVYASIDF